MIIKHASKAKHLFSDFRQVSPEAENSVPRFNTPEAISCWSANYFELEETQDRFLILFNEYIYTPLIFRLDDDNDFSDFEAELKEAIQQTWRAYGIPQHFIDGYLSTNADITCMKLTDRTSIGKLTSAVRSFSYCDEDINRLRLFQASFIAHYKKEMFKPTPGTELQHTRAFNYETYASWATAKNLEAGNYRAPEFSLYEMELEYIESSGKTLRKIEIPAFSTFSTLHLCIQTVYFWSDYHTWNFLIASSNGRDKPPVRRLRPDNPLMPPIELEAVNVQPEVDYAFDPSLKLKPLARIAPDYDGDFDWMYDGAPNFYPSTTLDVFFEETDYAIYSYDSGVGHTVRIRVTKRFTRDSDAITCTEACGDARGEDDSLPLLSIDGTVNVTKETPYDVPYLLTSLSLDKTIAEKIMAEAGGPEKFMLNLLNLNLHKKML